MSSRSVRLRTAATWATIAVVLTVGSGNPTASSSSVSALPLHVLLTLSSNLTTMSRQTLISEAERIWRREHVHIEWARPGHTIEHPDAPLRVLVVARPQPATPSTREWPVAELFPEASPRALAIASILGAQRVVDEATRSTRVEVNAPNDYRLGLVLGRAVAHEIGHFLLATGTHADSGLMRASVDAREFAAMDGNAFTLDRDASQWLRERLTTSNAAITTVRSGGFTYTRPQVVDNSLMLGDELLAGPSR